MEHREEEPWCPLASPPCWLLHAGHESQPSPMIPDKPPVILHQDHEKKHFPWPRFQVHCTYSRTCWEQSVDFFPLVLDATSTSDSSVH